MDVEFGFVWTFDSEAQANEAGGRLMDRELEVAVVRGNGEETLWQVRARMIWPDHPHARDEDWLHGYLEGRYDGFCGEFERALSDLRAEPEGGGFSLTF